jgi:hypothetical protein
LQYPLCAMIPELNGSLPTLYYEKNRVTSELLSERSIPMKFLVYICHINIFWFGGKIVLLMCYSCAINESGKWREYQVSIRNWK